MNRLLCPALLLVILSAGCRCPAEPEKLDGRVQLVLSARFLTRDEIGFDYQIVNGLRGAIYFICPDPSCGGDPKSGDHLPFYEVQESTVLAVYSYKARKPHNQLREPYQYKLMKVEPGDAFTGHVSLLAPYVTHRPYVPAEYQPEIIWSPMIDRFRLTIGYFVCPGTETGPECSALAETDLARRDEKETSEHLDCGSGQREIVPQHLISAEGGISHTGDWPGEAPHGWIEEPWDAGEGALWQIPKFTPYPTLPLF